MKLKGIRAKNFGRYSELLLDLSAPVTIIQGPNNTGKTTLANMIEWVLAGWTRQMARHDDRKNESYLIRDAEDVRGCEVLLEINKNQILKKRTKTGLVISLDNLPGRQEDIYRLLGLDGFQIKAALNNSFFIEQTQRKKLLFDILGVSANEKKLKKMLGALEVEDFYIEKTVPQVIAAGFEKGKAFAVESRREMKRELGSLSTTKPDDEVVEGHGKLSQINAEEIQKKLDELKTKRDDMVKQMGAGESVEQEIVKEGINLARLKSSKVQKEARMKELHNSNNINVDLERLSQMETELPSLQQKHNRLDAQVETARSKIKNLPASDGECPVCGSDMDVKKLKKNYESELSRLEKEMAVLNYHHLESVYNQMVKDQDKVVRIQGEIQSLQVEIEQTTKDIRESEERLKTLKPPDASLKERKQALEASIEKGGAMHRKVIDYHQSLFSYERSLKKAKTLEDAIEQWDKVDKALSPDGIQKELLSDATSDFKKRLSKTTGNALFGEVSFDDDLNFFIDGRPEILLDPMGSEMLRLGFFIQEAIAHLSGLKIWIVDRVDVLDVSNRNLLMELVESVKKDYDNIILFLTSTEEKTGTKDIKIYDTRHL